MRRTGDDELNDIYNAYIGLIIAVIRLARRDANGGFIDLSSAHTYELEQHWRRDAKRFLAYIEGDNNAKGQRNDTSISNGSGGRRQAVVRVRRPQGNQCHDAPKAGGGKHQARERRVRKGW